MVAHVKESAGRWILSFVKFGGDELVSRPRQRQYGNDPGEAEQRASPIARADAARRPRRTLSYP
jgi:hypothetical protein